MSVTTTHECKPGSRGYLVALEQIASELHESVRILLNSKGCVYKGRAEIKEEISGQFDITIDDANRIRRVIDSFKKISPEQV